MLLAVGLLLIAWAYWPGLQGPWLLDDFVNLAPLAKISLQQDFYLDVIRGNLSGPLGRPVSMSSFVIESLYFDVGVEGQKLLGLVLHLINGCLVYMLTRRIFAIAGQNQPEYLALLVALLWLSSPLLLSTTLYVVQRMTLLATFFSLLSLIAYCRSRQAMQSGLTGLGWLVLAFMAVVLAIFSKESGILSLPLMTALELCIFGFRNSRGRVQVSVLLGHALVIGLPVLVLTGLLAYRPDYLTVAYQHREFSLTDRLFTESRVLWDYCAQLLWPDLGRMGVYQDDFTISRGLFAPKTTAFALLAWIAVVAACISALVMRRGSLVTFGVIVFLVGHTLESTIIPLELYFEHRNYLPAVGLCFSLVAAVGQVQGRWPLFKYWLFAALCSLLLRNWVMLGSQAVVWSDSRLLHMEAVNAHPESPRALLSLAQLYAADGNLNSALEMLRRVPVDASGGEFHILLRQALFHCSATHLLPADFFADTKALTTELSRSDVSDNFQQLVRMLIDEKCTASAPALLADQLRAVLTKDERVRGSLKILGSMLLLENHLQRFQRALGYAELILKREPDDIMALQFVLYLSSVLEMPELRQKALNSLLELRDAGELSRQETYNLELFLEE